MDPSAAQRGCQLTIEGVRSGRLTMGTSVGASVCLPSFHAFWAVVSTQALWTFRWMRIPAAMLGALIVASTLTTGWHYGVDTLAGVLLAAICGTFACFVVRR
jgi:membrane-associated phospholipid phosphatase